MIRPHPRPSPAGSRLEDRPPARGRAAAAARRVARVAWASPWTLLGLSVGVLALALGARPRRVAGTIEIAGGVLGRTLRQARWGRGFAAITLGHVILGTDASLLARLRAHEQEHVRQYETWGPLFVTLYLASSLAQWCRGEDPYRANRFEREAFAAEDRPTNA